MSNSTMPQPSVPQSLRRPSRVEIIPNRTVHPRSSLAPLEVPPVTIHDYPALPCPRPPTFLPDYTVSTHVFPAAYPRCPSDVWTRPPSNESPEQRDIRITHAVDKLSQLKEAQEQGRDTRPPLRKIYWTVANRYVHHSGSTNPGLTLVFLHGIGAHKETWEPIIRHILNLIDRKEASIHIQEIWTLDSVQHGDSAILNEQVLGDTFDCADYGRDLANFLLSYLPGEVMEAGALPTRLERVPESDAAARELLGIPGRMLVGVGHSLGACSFVYPAVQYPALFSSLILVESFTIAEYIKHLDAHRKNEKLCMKRRWQWRTRDEATKAIKTSPYYRDWDPASLEEFIRFALIELPDGTVRTKAHPYLEAVMLFERCLVYETWEILEKIDPSIAMHWVWGGRSGRQGGPIYQAQTSFRRADNSTNDYHAELGHLLPQQGPDLLATDIFRFLTTRYETKSRL